MLSSAFIAQINEILAPDEVEKLCLTLTETMPPVSIRLNPKKLLTPPSKCPSPYVEPQPSSGAFDLLALKDGRVPWCSQGFYLKQRPTFTIDPLLHAGAYYVQEASSMFVEQAYKRILAESEPQTLLDLCAAPGGKSTLWRSLLPDGALLVANEPIRPRAHILEENLLKWGHPDVVCTSAFPAEFARLKEFFDVVAADVPCSGEGMFRKDPNACAEWSHKAVAICAQRQWEIIRDIWPALRTGGFLVYSTCTFNQKENEEMLVQICRELGAQLIEIPVEKAWHIAGSTLQSNARPMPVYHFFPHLVRGEGFFLALLQKTSGTANHQEFKSKSHSPKRFGMKETFFKTSTSKFVPTTEPQTKSSKTTKRPAPKLDPTTCLSESQHFQLLSTGETIFAVRQTLFQEVQQICSTVKTLHAGIPLAELKGTNLVPHPALALSSEFNTNAFPTIELSYPQALAYLRREALTLPANLPKGHAIASYLSHPLGFLNNLGPRANNLYPQNWRIRNL